MTIHRVKVLWTGMPGAPGVSTHYLGSAPAAADLTAFRTFYNALIAGLPNTLTLTIPGSGDILDETTGTITGTWTATAPSTVVGTAASGYAAPVGTLAHWVTGGVVRGRRVRGTTFIVPTVNQFEPGGTPIGTWITTLQTAATALVTSLGANLVVWARPLRDPDPPHAIVEPGSLHGVTGATVPDKAMVLRSRRD